jgi:3-oxoacyl-[acyl-carrier-protein] synthase II
MTAQDIDHVSAHATSTPEGDPAELMGFKSVFGYHIANVSITAIKSSMGHTLGAAGGIAAVAAIQAMREGRVPPTLNLENPAPEAAGMDLTPLVAREREVRAALVNSFGFGGQNAAIVLRRWDES